MLFLDFFEKTYLAFNLSALIFLVFATFYVSNLKQQTGLFYFLGGFVLLLLTSLLQQNAAYFYSQAVSAKMLVFIEMICLLISTLLFINSASYILLNKPLSVNLIFSFASGVLVLIAYAIFVADSAYIVDNIRYVLPIVGISYVFLSFVSVPRVWTKFSYLLVLTACVGFVCLMLCSMIYKVKYAGYLPAVCVYVLGISYILMSVDALKKTIKQFTIVQEKNAANIKNIIKSSPFPIVLSRLGDDMLIMANNNALKLFGLEEKEIGRYRFKDFFVDTENRKLLTSRLEFNREVHDFEILVKTAAGNTPFWLLLSANVVEYNDDIVLYCAFQDITARKRYESVLQSQADRDPLTSVYNRRYFENKVVDKIKNAHINRTKFAIFMIDADKFKNINDRYGHKIGDKVLIELAGICERSLRQEDLVARYGGEEFVVFVDNVDSTTAVMVANRLRKAIEDLVVYSDEKQPVTFSVSIGVALSGISDNVALMIKMADDAMYLAKQNGRNRVELYDKEEIEKMNIKEQSHANSQMHPAFSNEDNEEISLLDGIESVSLLEE